MRIHLLNDCHLEFGEIDDYVPPECDVVLLAGDISTGVHGVWWAKETFKQPVIYVAGNHEMYGKKVLQHHYEALKEEAAGSNVHFLQNESVVIDGVKFFGATMWTDFNLMGEGVPLLGFQRNMNDYAQILFDNGAHVRPLYPDDVAMEHAASKLALIDELRKPFDGKTVVVTHHAPSEMSIHPRYAGDFMNAAYASRLENIMLDYNPALWVHGHVHNSFDYVIGNTRVCCNPRGYKGHELNPEFDPGLIIEI